MSKHRRSRAQRARRPVHLGIAAGVAGTVAVTGTVVASATATTAATPRTQPVSFSPERAITADTATALSMTAQHEQVTNEKAVAALREARELAAKRRALAAKRAAEKRAAAVAKRAEAARKAAEARAAAEAAEQASRSRTTSTSTSSGGSSSDAPRSASVASVLSIAAAQQGDSYVYGASGPDSFDCSGFTMYVFGKVGISLPHSSSAQAGVAQRVSTPMPGDLVFVYNGGGGTVGHVAIYAGNGYWYEASNPGEPVGKHRAWSTNVSYGRVL